jgi:hypothetical protein
MRYQRMSKRSSSIFMVATHELKRGPSEEDAERIAAATGNKTKREKSETKGRSLWIFSYSIHN